MVRSTMRAGTATALLLLALLAACGPEGERCDVDSASRSTLHVRVAGMVQSDGIT